MEIERLIIAASQHDYFLQVLPSPLTHFLFAVSIAISIIYRFRIASPKGGSQSIVYPQILQQTVFHTSLAAILFTLAVVRIDSIPALLLLPLALISIYASARSDKAATPKEAMIITVGYSFFLFIGLVVTFSTPHVLSSSSILGKLFALFYFTLATTPLLLLLDDTRFWRFKVTIALLITYLFLSVAFYLTYVMGLPPEALRTVASLGPIIGILLAAYKALTHLLDRSQRYRGR